MAAKAMDLFEAYTQSKLPMDEGYIVSSFFKQESAYSIYEIMSYSAVKDCFVSGDSITLQTNGKKLYVLVEPATYPTGRQNPIAARRKTRSSSVSAKQIS
jgi:hypothetical protein